MMQGWAAHRGDWWFAQGSPSTYGLVKWLCRSYNTEDTYIFTGLISNNKLPSVLWCNFALRCPSWALSCLGVWLGVDHKGVFLHGDYFDVESTLPANRRGSLTSWPGQIIEQFQSISSIPMTNLNITTITHFDKEHHNPTCPPIWMEAFTKTIWRNNIDWVPFALVLRIYHTTIFERGLWQANMSNNLYSTANDRLSECWS